MTEGAPYEVVVVGGGTAGSVLAARLSEDPGVRVLLLEAGSAHRPPQADRPAAWPALLGTELNWGDATVEQRATGTSAFLPRGRVLGGSSVINGMTFARGHRSGYDAWERRGAKGWGFDDLLPYFRRSETARGRDAALRGTEGPLDVGPAVGPNPVITALLAAAAEAGHPRAADISGGLEEGFGLPDLNIADGRRQDAAQAYLHPAADRPGLDVVTGALVHRVLLDGDRCVGVEYGRDGRVHTARCTGEVVLAAGAIGSPQLLMLSGIGPAGHLREHGVAAGLDLPGVGANLHDHPIVNLSCVTEKPVPPGRNNHGEAFGLVRSRDGLDAPDLHLLLVDSPGHMPSGVASDSGFTIAVSPMLPFSRGSLRLASAEPGAAPLLDPDYFGDDRDMRAVLSGMRMAREIATSPAMAEWRCTEVLPGPGADDEESLRTYVRNTLASYCHPVGTCRMGTDDMAVVDTALRVRGVRGLRVADASVIPSANTNATVYAIAERAAELIGTARGRSAPATSS